MDHKYFTAPTRRLRAEGISTGNPDNGKLPILLGGQEIGVAVLSGGLLVRKGSLSTTGQAPLPPRCMRTWS